MIKKLHRLGLIVSYQNMAMHRMITCVNLVKAEYVGVGKGRRPTNCYLGYLQGQKLRVGIFEK